MTSKVSRRKELLRQYFLNAYRIALLKQASEAASKPTFRGTASPDLKLLRREAS